ncbi:MAG: riboflavin synthase [Candidatus Cloacimonetes bacterium HGW-Cloacimonetes-1]|jgi:riboflavin synthase|nr:MAG: riboflavin synthase [Candidatus Cloacimonetes bacterium HGW-Cloacimonetes-1]
MFTGIIEATKPVLSIGSSQNKTIVTMERPSAFDDLSYGSSIACNGICLTVLKFDSKTFSVEVMNETKAKTNAGYWKAGALINLERALKVGSRLDGHWVQGHIDTTTKLLKREILSGTTYLWFGLPDADRKLVVAQGSIAINGISLTIAGIRSDSFSVALIGHTESNTNLDALDSQSTINIEYDVLGKYILNMQQAKDPKISEKWLYEQGF